MNVDPFEDLPPMTPEEVEKVRARAMSVPISGALGLQLLGLNRGVCVMRMTRDEKFDGIYKSMHGGFLMTLADYLERHANPTEEDIRVALSGNLCRCTGYAEIVNAALEAAKEVHAQRAPK